MNHVAACTKLHELKMFTHLNDTKLANQMALSLRTLLAGMTLAPKQIGNQKEESKERKPNSEERTQTHCYVSAKDY